MMSRILNTPVKVHIPEYPNIDGISLRSSEDEYLELYNETDKTWHLITIKNKKGDRRDILKIILMEEGYILFRLFILNGYI